MNQGERGMSIKKAMLIAITFALLAVLGVSFIVFNLRTQNQFEKCIKLEMDSQAETAVTSQTETLEIKAEGLVPGGKPIEYTISFDVALNDNYKMTLSFLDKESSLLKDYVDVTIGVKSKSQPVYSGKMSDLFNTKDVVFGDKVNTKDSLYIRFSMDEDVSDINIMGKSVDFDTVLKVEKS